MPRGKLECPHIAFFNQRLSAMPGAHAQEGQVSPAREGLKMTAGVSDPVHLVEGVGEVGYAGWIRDHELSAELGL